MIQRKKHLTKEGLSTIRNIRKISSDTLNVYDMKVRVGSSETLRSALNRVRRVGALRASFAMELGEDRVHGY